MDDQDLAKTAGSPAFYAPEMCYSGENPLTHADLEKPPAPKPPSPPPGTPKKHAITKAIDVWALGVTLYCLLFGDIPFDAQNQFELIHMIPRDEYAVPERMGADRLLTSEGEGLEVLDLLSSLMEKDPVKRITLPAVKVPDPFVFLLYTHPFPSVYPCLEAF